MEYTKGDWKAQRNAAGEWSIITDDDFIGTIGRHFNAHLISAGPDLYEALKELRDWLRSDDVQVLGKGLTEQFGIPKTQEKVDKAIAKADGK